ncbi:MAG: DNA mismatch repair protein MutS, partial [Planctomycetota bacterium]
MARTTDPLDTPMMRQYRATKAEHPDCLLFMRMGDFFELFLDDAREAAQILGLTLTARNKHDANPIPMAGVPWHSLEGHLPKLLAAGKKVAIMDQLEDPSTAKGLVERGLTRIITAGTLLDEDVLEDGAANFLVALSELDGAVGVAALDCSTGRFQVEEAEGPRELGLVLARLAPAELLLNDELLAAPDTDRRLAALFEGATPPPVAGLPGYAWRAADARRTLCESLGVSGLDGFGIGPDEDHLCAAAAAALRYAEANSHHALSHVREIVRVHRGTFLVMDAACRRNLEILRNQRDRGRTNTLLAVVDRTRTAPGARLLAEWLARPLASVAGINARHDAVDALVADDALRTDLRDQLAEVYDLERLLTRVATGRCHARDLVQLAQTMRAARAIAAVLERQPLPALLAGQAAFLEPPAALLEQIETTLIDDPPLSVAEGGFIRDGVEPELDELRALRTGANDWLAGYQVREAERTGIPKIKVGYNKVFGYYLEVGKAHAQKVPPDFVRKQTLVNAERYITDELKEYEDRALGAEERIRKLESELFTALREAAHAQLPALQACARALAVCDVLAGLAAVARSGGWARPTVDDSLRLELDQARHPVVESVLGRGAFVANDIALDAAPQRAADGPGRLTVITGPNMSGKSTYIRQVALCVVLAQAGSFVPAAGARIGVVDRLFTRVGAGDELARNMSTFMVEMAETANILNNASRHSLVVLDEVGRGTSTFDGVSL